jgi:glycosyltransferase involved in cell wall biosynthesis
VESWGFMKISIVVNNYNYERFLRQTIDSALAQDHPDVEVIVADDGSTDGSRDLIATYGDRIKRVEGPNGGQRAAYNAGYGLVTGEAVIFLDADDWLYPQACSEVARAWRKGVSKVQYFLDIVDAHGRSMGRRVPRTMHEAEDAMKVLAQFGTYGSAAGSGNAYAVAYLRQIMPLDASKRHLPADSEPILLAPAYGEIVNVPASLGAYRIHKTAGSEPLVLNNMPSSLWAELGRIEYEKVLVARRLAALNRPHRSPMLFAPWEVRMLMLCLRFGGPRPEPPLADRLRPTWFALSSLWAWPALSTFERLLIGGWMLAVRALPLPLATRLADINRQLAGSATRAGTAATPARD